MSLAVSVLMKKQKKHLPGPPGLPLIGNTHQAPRPFSWKWYETLRNQYGKIFRLRVLNDNFVIINDPKIAEELLGRRSLNYSSRKFLAHAGYYRSGNRRMILMPYGNEFRMQRVGMNLLYRPEGIASNRVRQGHQATKLVMDMLTSPESHAKHLKQYSGGIALGIAFGMSLEAAEQETPNLINNTASLGNDLMPGAHLVHIFPILEKLPDWMAPWRLQAKISHEHETALFERFAAHSRVQNLDFQTKSLVAQLWETQDELGLDDKAIIYTGGVVGEAGPDVLKTAQEELDRVIGERLPTFSDFYDLPYIYAVTKEILRWIPVTPLSFPHLASEDDEYNGFYIPKNSQVVASIWNMHRDPANFSNPAIFDPLRWYNPTEDEKVRQDASMLDGIWTFGICPGRRLAVDSIWIAVAHLLWAFDITPKDPIGTASLSTEDIDAHLMWRDSVNIEPREVNAIITPRSTEKKNVIEEAWRDVQFQ
ncbi:cytochrome P450 [Flammula alnicola]|nr:cytochrome P450 [Flammula alnicola]